jgi:NADH-quinone oxidoreductase subunit L
VSPAWLWLVPAAPLLGAVLLGAGGDALAPRRAALIGVGSTSLAALAATLIGVRFIAAPPPGGAADTVLWTLLRLPGLTVQAGLYLDPLALLMMLVITVASALIHIFSSAYMAGEAGYSRYFAYLTLFTASMLLLVLADDLLVLFIGWEGVGICSYLLVGFWFRDPANGLAARKSFIVTRIADTAMLAGLLLLAVTLGTLSLPALGPAARHAWPDGGALPTLAALLLLTGGLGKSAQVPFQTWLPDAMAGPTPVSALIHAATMVTAGVYLVARTHALFALVPATLGIIAGIAAVTMLLASLAALVQADIKRVLAYSTIAQIGYMFLALGVGAWAAAMFHFFTHALFKALLFLTAGGISHRLHHEQNMFRMGGLARAMPGSFIAFLVGAASLAALPLVSAGWFSKEAILGAVWAAPGAGAALWAAALGGAALTALYIFRAVFLVFFGPVRTAPGPGYGPRMGVPLALLAAGALTAGWLWAPDCLGGWAPFAGFLAASFGPAAPPRLPAAALLAGLLAPLAGLGLAYAGHAAGLWWRLGTRPAGALRHFLQAGLGFDSLYDALLVRPYGALARRLQNDPIDRVFTGLAGLAMVLHAHLRQSQVGQIRRYAGWVMAGSLLTVALLVFA